MKKFFNLYDARLGWVALLGLILLLPSQALAGKNVFKVLEDVEIHGFASSSYSYNFNKPPSRINNLRIFDVDDNSFKFDVGELVFLKETPDVGDIGFRFDLTFGFSLPEIEQQPRSSATDTGDDDFDVQQGYVSWKAPVGSGLQLDFGKFITHIGAEVIEGYDGWNANFSRSFLFGLAIPFVHTGIRASYDVNDQISVMAALVNGIAPGETDSNSSKALGLQVGYTPNDKIGILLNWIGGGGNEDGGAPPGFDNEKFLQIYDVVVDVGVTNELSLQFNMDYGMEENTSAKLDGSSSKWWGFATIARYDINKWFSMNARAEYLNDSDGWGTGTLSTNVWELTLTPEFRIHDNLVVRFEYRHDDASTPVFEDEDGTFTDSQDTIAMNALVYF